MAILRLSITPMGREGTRADRWGIHAPDDDGHWLAGPADPGGEGMIAPVDDPGVRLARWLGVRRARFPWLAHDAPVVIVINGFRYAPRVPPGRQPEFNPHADIFRADQLPKALGFADDRGESGLCIAFAWESNPNGVAVGWGDWLAAVRLSRRGVRTAYALAYADASDSVAQALYALLIALERLLPERRVEIVTHSLGSVVALNALALLADRKRSALRIVQRVMMLSAAVHAADAKRLLDIIRANSPARPQIYNLFTGGDWVLRFLAHRFAQPRQPGEGFWLWLAYRIGGGATVGQAGRPLALRWRNWLDVQLDREDVKRWLQRHGYDDGSGKGDAHGHNATLFYGPYRRLYRAILRDGWVIGQVRRMIDPPPEGPSLRTRSLSVLLSWLRGS